jgi:hypothetical protein
MGQHKDIAFVQRDISKGCKNGRHRYFTCESCGAVHDLLLPCNRRFTVQCPECSDRWRKKQVMRFKEGIANMNKPKFMTLTLQKEGLTEERLKSIWGMRNYVFKKLRRGKKNNQGLYIRPPHKIGSWVAVCEVPNHIHIVYEGSYIPEHELSELWFRITGDSFMVDVRPLGDEHDKRRAAGYLAKYLGKSQHWDEENLSLFKGFHIVNSRGLVLVAFIPSCPCPCGVGPLKVVNDEEFNHHLRWIVDLNNPIT